MEYPFKRRRHPMEKTGRILTYIGVPLAIIAELWLPEPMNFTMNALMEIVPVMQGVVLE